MEVVPLPLELSGGVDLVSHDAGDGLNNLVKYAVVGVSLPSQRSPSIPPSSGGACRRHP